jgi:hypothetical protein
MITTACTAPSLGIFYTLERESPVTSDDKGLSKTATFKQILEMNGNWYFIGTSMFKCPVAGAGKAALQGYSQVGLPDGYTRILAAAVQDTRLYVTLRNSSNQHALYQYNGSSWAAISHGGDSTYVPWDLLSANRPGSDPVLLLLAKLSPSGVYEEGKLQVINNGLITASPELGGATFTVQPRFLVNDGGNFHIFTNQGVHYTPLTATDIATNWSSAAASPTSRTYTRARSVGTDIVLLSIDGYIARSTDGTSWANSDQQSFDSKPVYFTDIMEVTLDDAPNPSYTRVLATSDNHGLLEITSLSSSAHVSQTNGNYHSTDIYRKSLYTLANGGTDGQLLVAAENLGIWSAYYYTNPGALSFYPGIVWTHE